MNLDRPFFTRLDPNKRIRGSRDPLGFTPVWTALGRKVVLNVSTVSTSLRGFTTLLIARYLCDKAVEEGRIQPDSYTDAFLKIEQLIAYCRIAVHQVDANASEDDIRGILRVKARLAERSIRISVQPEWQILSNQRTYGLWGLYSVPAQSSGLLLEDHSHLSLVARQFVETEYVPRLGKDTESMLDVLRKDREFDPLGKDAAFAKRVAALCAPALTKSEVQFYTCHLLQSGEPQGIQSSLWRFMREVASGPNFGWTEPFTIQELREVIKRCSAQKEEQLAMLLNNIDIVEAYLAPCAGLFGFVLERDGQSLRDVANELQRTWGATPKRLLPETDKLFSVLSVAGDAMPGPILENFRHIAFALKTADYVGTFDGLIKHNRLVMQERKGSAWIEIKRGRIRVRLKEDASVLPSKKEVGRAWRNPYFLNSLKALGAQVTNGGRQ